MYVIAVLNQKGGSGKTTIATHLARGLQLTGHSVVLVDSDIQGSARDWAFADENNPVPTIAIYTPTIDRDLPKITDKDFAVIDGSCRSHEILASAIKASDMVLIPVQPSPYDVWATVDFAELINARKSATAGIPKAAIVVNRVITGSKIGADASNALQSLNLPILKTHIAQRVIYPNATSLGKTALDIEAEGIASTEIKSLTSEVLQAISNNNF